MDNDELYSRLSRHGRIDRYESGSNRRAEPRVMVMLKATLRDDGDDFSVVTRDVSRTSVGIISDRPIDPGRTVRLELTLPWDEVISRDLEIVRCVESTGFYDLAGKYTAAESDRR